MNPRKDRCGLCDRLRPLRKLMNVAANTPPICKPDPFMGFVLCDLARQRVAGRIRARAEIAKLEHNWNSYDYDYSPDDEPLTVHGSGSLTVGDARRARAALKEPKR